MSSNLRAGWTVSESGDCDVLILGDSIEGQDRPAGAAVVQLRKRADAGPGLALGWPIRAEELIDLLNSCGSRVPGAVPLAAPAPTSVAVNDPVVNETGAARLNRWPPFSFLSGRPSYARLSSLLTRHSLNAAQLSSLSGQPLAECETFMRELDALKLLAREHTPPRPAAPAPQAAVVVRRGLLSTLRRKLGIERAQA